MRVLKAAETAYNDEAAKGEERFAKREPIQPALDRAFGTVVVAEPRAGLGGDPVGGITLAGAPDRDPLAAVGLR